MTVIIGGTGTANGITSFSSPATFGGTLATASRGISNASIPAGGVLQVVFGSTAATTTVASTTWTATNLSASITPYSSSSKIMVMCSCCFYVPSGGGGGMRLYRGASSIFDPSGYDGSGANPYYLYGNSAVYAPLPLNYLDSPATTSTTTYSIYIASYSSSFTCRFNYGGSSVYATSTMTLMEIAQ